MKIDAYWIGIILWVCCIRELIFINPNRRNYEQGYKDAINDMIAEYNRGVSYSDSTRVEKFRKYLTTKVQELKRK